MTRLIILIALAVALPGDCSRIKVNTKTRTRITTDMTHQKPVQDTCSGMRVEHCRDCMGEWECGTCYKVLEDDPSSGIVCTSKMMSSECRGSNATFATTVKCKVETTSVARPPSQPTCPSEWLTQIVAAQERVSVPDNTFNLCLPNTPAPDEGILNIPPVVKYIPAIITTAVEWLLFAGGYTPHNNGTAVVGNRGTYVPSKLKGQMRYLPSSSHPWIAYTQRGVSRPKKLIVYCHGNFEGVHQIHHGQFDKLAQELDAMVVGFEYPGYGGVDGTKGQSTIMSVNFVTMAGLNYARQVWGWDPKDIIIIGRSIGTGAAAEAAATYERVGLPLGGLILISPYYSIKKLVANFVGGIDLVAGWATKSYYFETGVNIGSMTETPVLIAHGITDEVIPVTQADDIYKEVCDECKASGRMRYLRLAKFTHNNLGLDDILDYGGRNWIAENPTIAAGNGPHEAFASQRCMTDAKHMCRRHLS